MRLVAMKLFMLFLVFILPIKASARTDKVTVTKIESIYEIVVVSEGRSLIPIHPDKGFFPKWRRELRLLTRGPGKSVSIEGAVYRKFVIGKDIDSILDNCIYSSGEILFSEETKRLIIHASLAKGYSHYMNHSGKYDGVEFVSEDVHFLESEQNLITFSGSIVRLKGKYTGHRVFSSNGDTYEVTDLCAPDSNKESSIMARVIQPNYGVNPYLFVLRKEHENYSRCCGPSYGREE